MHGPRDTVVQLLQDIATSPSPSAEIYDSLEKALNAALNDNSAFSDVGVSDDFINAIAITGASEAARLANIAAEHIDPLTSTLPDALINRASQIATDEIAEQELTQILLALNTIFERRRRIASDDQLTRLADIAVASNTWEPQPSTLCAWNIELSQNDTLLASWLIDDARCMFALHVLGHIDVANLRTGVKSNISDALERLTTKPPSPEQSEVAARWLTERLLLERARLTSQ